MSIFISAQDYLTMSNECQQISFTIYNHNYKLWCKKDKVEQAEMIVEKILPIIEKIASKNTSLSFDKILLMSMIDILSKEKEYKPEQQQISQNNNYSNTETQDLINNFVEVLLQIKNELENNDTDNNTL